MNRTLVALGASMAVCAAGGVQAARQPNIILILVDDMGYSDVGCYGSEIPTPNIDRLARNGIRYTQFYSTARSCPTRASLMTGLYAHQAGIGGMSEDPTPGRKPGAQPPRKPAAYQGFLNRNCVTMAEVLREAGYHTYMAGKWHLGMHGREKWPLQRGFDRFYGILAGACSYLQPHGGRGLTLDNTQLAPPEQPYYTTDAFTDYALEFLNSNQDGRPYFLYLAYNAPHWPLHAKQADIDKFIGKYDGGWERIREARFRRQIRLGIADRTMELAEWESRHWDELTDEERRNSALRMSVYAAQVHCMDYNVGRILDWVEQSGQAENTIIVFLSDNGACAEPHTETGFGTVADINDPESWVAPSYGLPWAQVSNTPLRKYKIRAYEGGLTVPLIVSWPALTDRYAGQIRRNVGFLPDLMATFVEAARTTYPETYGGNAIHPLEGSSLVPTFGDPQVVLHDYLFGEHFDNCYVRHGDWKAVKDEKSKHWELFDMAHDRAERHDLSARYPELLQELVAKWKEWADTHDVYPKRLQPER